MSRPSRICKRRNLRFNKTRNLPYEPFDHQWNCCCSSRAYKSTNPASDRWTFPFSHPAASHSMEPALGHLPRNAARLNCWRDKYQNRKLRSFSHTWRRESSKSNQTTAKYWERNLPEINFPYSDWVASVSNREDPTLLRIDPELSDSFCASYNAQASEWISIQRQSVETNVFVCREHEEFWWESVEIETCVLKIVGGKGMKLCKSVWITKSSSEASERRQTFNRIKKLNSPVAARTYRKLVRERSPKFQKCFDRTLETSSHCRRWGFDVRQDDDCGWGSLTLARPIGRFAWWMKSQDREFPAPTPINRIPQCAARKREWEIEI